MIGFSVNGKSVDLDVDPSTPLLWVIREQLGLTGTKYGCGMAQCARVPSISREKQCAPALRPYRGRPGKR